MVIIGAGGFAKELLQILHQRNQLLGLAFYDDINRDKNNSLFKEFPVLRDENEVKNHFNLFGNDFIIGIGNSMLRYKMYKKFESIGGILCSCISSFSRIGNYDVNIGAGTNILDNAIVSNSVRIGLGCIIYYNAVVSHDCIINDFVEVSPSTNILGRCSIGAYTHIGSNATVLPNIVIGENVIVGAGAVVTKDIPNDSVAVGAPARVIKTLKRANDS